MTKLNISEIKKTLHSCVRIAGQNVVFRVNAAGEITPVHAENEEALKAYLTTEKGTNSLSKQNAALKQRIAELEAAQAKGKRQ